MILDVDTDYYYLSPYTEIAQTALVFSIASDPSDTPVIPILSELSYTEIESAGFGLEGGYTTGLFYGYGLNLQAKMSRSVIYDGKDQDSDYDRLLTDEGTLVDNEFSRSYADLGKDYINRYQIGVFLQKYDPYKSKHTLSMGVGLSGDEYGLRSINGVQVIPDEGPFNGLDSHYDASVDAVFISMQYDYRFWPHTLSFDYQYARIDYEAEADWNLRSDFAHPKSFTQEGKGSGDRMALKYSYELSDTSWFMLSLKPEQG